MVAHKAFDGLSDLPILETLSFTPRVRGQTSDGIRNLKEHNVNQIHRLQKEIDDMRTQLRVRSRKPLLLSYRTPPPVRQFPIRFLSKVRAALLLMKEQHGVRKITAEEALGERYVFTARMPDIALEVVAVAVVAAFSGDGICSFPLIPTHCQTCIIFCGSEWRALDASITEKRAGVDKSRERRRDDARIVNAHKARLDDLKTAPDEKERSRRLLLIDGVLRRGYNTI
jgi:hypothetical protein